MDRPGETRRQMAILAFHLCDGYVCLNVDNSALSFGGPACQRGCPHDALVRMDLGNLGGLSA